MISVAIPASYEAERRYVIGVLLGEFLGLEFRCETKPDLTGEVVIGMEGQARLSVLDGLFSIPPDAWLTASAAPNPPYVAPREADRSGILASAGIENLPVIAWGQHRPMPLYTLDGNHARLNLDVFGVAFYMLTRYEEYVADEGDAHGRFLAKASFAARHGLLERPIVNEYLGVFWALLVAVLPGASRRSREFRQLVSHDVDNPFDLLFKSGKRLVKSLAGDLVKRRAPGLAVKRALNWNRVRRGDWTADPYNTFEWIWRQSEKRGLKSAFYFMAGRTDPARDGEYELEHPAIRGLIRASAERGHEIGLHPSYASCSAPEVIKDEFLRLRRVCEEEGVAQNHWGGRHHYLRWSARETAGHWESAGLAYDSTLGFADRIGFRCGTCYEYPLFDLAGRSLLNLRERPLLVMDVSLISPEYMGIDDVDAAVAKVAGIKRACRQFSGDFTLLWHNDRLTTSDLKAMYLRCLDI